MILTVGYPGASANLQWRPPSAGFALAVNADKLTSWENTAAVVQLFTAVSTAVRALGTLNPGNITAWSDGGSPR